MKTKLFLFTLLALMFTSCSSSDDDNDEQQLVINPTSMELTVGDNSSISTSLPCTFTSEDENVATVSSSGQIKAVGSGETNIVATTTSGKQKASCAVKVSWKYNYFDEPITDFSLSLAEIKAKETHTFQFQTSYDDATHSYVDYTILYYTYSVMGEDQQLEYKFNGAVGEKGSLLEIEVDFNPKYIEYIAQQMEERYGKPTITTNNISRTTRVYYGKGFTVTVHSTTGMNWISYEPSN